MLNKKIGIRKKKPQYRTTPTLHSPRIILGELVTIVNLGTNRRPTLYIYIYKRMTVDMSITKAARVPTWDPAKFFSSEFATDFFLGGKDLVNYFNMRPTRKINVTWGSRKIGESNLFIRDEWPFADKGI